ncbi:MAG: hypothetical protein AB7F19_07430 [Candidatus Babeliales bacterium]
MATSAQEQLYPSATEDAKSIPMEIMKPTGFYLVSAAEGAQTAFAIPTAFEVCSIYSTEDAFMAFDSEPGELSFPVPDGIYPNILFLPARTMMTVQLPTVLRTGTIIPVFADLPIKVFVQSIQKWAGLGLRRQLASR